jgi:hypothetical protein
MADPRSWDPANLKRIRDIPKNGEVRPQGIVLEDHPYAAEMGWSANTSLLGEDQLVA